MAKVSADAFKVERQPKAYMHTHSGNIAFPMGHFPSAFVMIYHARSETIHSCSTKWGDYVDQVDWIPIYDGESLTILFGEDDG